MLKCLLQISLSYCTVDPVCSNISICLDNRWVKQSKLRASAVKIGCKNRSLFKGFLFRDEIISHATFLLVLLNRTQVLGTAGSIRNGKPFRAFAPEIALINPVTSNIFLPDTSVHAGGPDRPQHRQAASPLVVARSGYRLVERRRRNVGE